MKIQCFNLNMRLKLWQDIGNGKATCKSSRRIHKVIKKYGAKCVNSIKIHASDKLLENLQEKIYENSKIYIAF